MKFKKLAQIVLLSFALMLTPACLTSNIPGISVSSRLQVPYVDVIGSQIVGTLTTRVLMKNLDSETQEPVGEWTEDVSEGGSGFFIGNGYFVTANHVAEIEPYQMVPTPWGMFPIERAIKDPSWRVNGHEAIMIGAKGDIALLYVSGLKDRDGIYISPEPLKVGQQIGLYGRSFGMSYVWKTGVVGGLSGPEFFQKDEGDVYAVYSIPINSGDSGSAIFSVEKGQLVCVGMITAKIATGEAYSIGYKGGHLRNVLEQIIRGE